MTFSSMWPLLGLAVIPLIIIIYMLRPKGKKVIVPSLMLWRNAEVNSSSLSFVKKLLKNILMIIEIIIAILLILSLMSPYIRTGFGKNKVKTLIVLDTSGSMKHEMSDDGSNKKTRFDTAKAEITDYAASSDGVLSIMTCSDTTTLVVTNSTDKLQNKRAISNIKCTDTEGSINSARAAIESLEAEKIIIYTDAAGSSDIAELTKELGAEVRIIGNPVNNASLVSVTAAVADAGTYDIAADIQFFGDEETTADISFYDAKDNLLTVRSVTLMPESGKTVIVRGVKAEGGYIRAELTGIGSDSIVDDNVSYAVLNMKTSLPAYLVGRGNTYIEKAYKAATGQDIIKVGDIGELKEAEKGIVICDGGNYSAEEMQDMNYIIFNNSADAVGTVEGGYVRASSCVLTGGLSEFSFGAAEISYYTLPSWATEFMSIDGKTVGYYGINNNRKVIILGFDIRNTELPLMAEFPVFMANAVDFLADQSLVGNPYIIAGEEISVSPTIGDDAKITYLPEGADTLLSRKSEAQYAGIIECSSEGRTDYISVRFPQSESDGRAAANNVEGVVEKSSVSMSSLRRVLLFIALILLILDWFLYIRQNRRFTVTAAVTRGVLALLILLALIGVRLPGRRKMTATIFVVDMSDSSSENIGEMEKYITEKLKSLPSNNEYAILTFGRNSLSDQFLTDNVSFMSFGTEPDGTATDIESAVRNAAAMIPDSYSGRIVILTDGQETLGDIGKTGELLDTAGIELDSVIFESEEKNDVYVSSAEMPDKLYPGDKYSLVVNIYSNYETDAVVRVRQGGEEKMANSVHLKPGNNTYLFTLVAGDNPIEENDIIVEAEGDQISENDVFSQASSVVMAPKVLLVSGLTQDSSGLEDIMHTINQDVTSVSAINAPDTLEEMLIYKTIILDNCYRPDLPEGFLNNLSDYVKEYGGGLIVTGGDASFGPGGYRETSLEEVLPVSMTPKGLNEAPSMAMVMVIDHSGSMSSEVAVNALTGQADGRSKLAIALAATVEAINNLTPGDYVGVVTFDDSYEWTQPIGKVEEVKDSAIKAVMATPAGGGTVISPPLNDAVDKLIGTDVGIKHILLLTDGEGETRDFSDVIKKCKDNNITLSTVAVGNDSDQSLLEMLARECGGRYYFSASASEVPRIFAEEVYMSGTAYFKKGEFGLAMRQTNELVKGLYPEGTPIITQYVACSAKQNATEVMISEEEDPILCCWQYGLGKTVAWTTTASGTWNEGFAGMTDYAQMWRRILDYSCNQISSSGDDIRVEKSGERLIINYTAGDFGENTEIEGVITSPSGETEKINFTADSPGHYSADAIPSEMGIYNINVRRKNGEDIVAAQNAIATVHFSDEYRHLSNERYIRYISENGKILTVKDKLFEKIRVKKNGRRDITTLLILISLFMLLADIIIRRFNFSIPKHLFRKGKKEMVYEGAKAGDSDTSGGALNRRTQKEKNSAGTPVSGGQNAGGFSEMESMGGMAGGYAGARPAGGQNAGGFTGARPAGGMSAGGFAGSDPVAGQQTAAPVMNDTKAMKKAQKKAAKKDKKAKQQPQDSVLDTSLLLQKKQDRNDFKR